MQEKVLYFLFSYLIFLVNYGLSIYVIPQCQKVNSTETGYCLKYAACRKLGGHVIDTCPFILTECCSLARSESTTINAQRSNLLCDSFVTAPITLITPDSGYFKEDRSCEITINPTREDSKLKIDLVKLDFNSNEDRSEKLCQDDYIEVEVNGVSVKLCDYLYNPDNSIENGISDDPILLTINTKTRKDEELPVWQILITEESLY